MSPSRGLFGGNPRTPSPPPRRLTNLENIEPPTPTPGAGAVATAKSQLTAKEKQRKLISEAAAAEVSEEIQEVEDIEWRGPAYAADLPFVGFTFTPTMLTGDVKSRQHPSRVPFTQAMNA